MKTKTDFSSKPYNRCLTCPYRSVRCDGPRTSAMELKRWCEFMHDMKEVNGLTNTYIAEKSGVSLKTIEKIMAQNADQDIMRETARRIEDVIIGSSNQYPCILAYEENAPHEAKHSETLRELERVLSENEVYKTTLENIHNSYNAEMKILREEEKKKTDYLLAQIERLRKEVDDLWAENRRKSKIVDLYVELRSSLNAEKNE